MGDINLLGMIRKIKSSLSGFVSTSDKATKSKFGIVKVGDNISVSSGTISVPVATEETYGVVKAGGSGGLSFDTLYTEPETSPPGQNAEITLTASSEGYKLLVVIIRSSVDATIFATHIFSPEEQNKRMSTAGSAPADSQAYNWKYNANGTSLSCVGGNSANVWHKVYGIK